MSGPLKLNPGEEMVHAGGTDIRTVKRPEVDSMCRCGICRAVTRCSTLTDLDPKGETWVTPRHQVHGRMPGVGPRAFRWNHQSREAENVPRP
jgi:hypothetical protein